MANRNQLPPTAGGQHRPLLPAPSPQNANGLYRGNGVDGIDGLDGVQSKGSGKVMKRAKVTAVACQPCQRRKSKVGSLFYLFELILTTKVRRTTANMLCLRNEENQQRMRL